MALALCGSAPLHLHPGGVERAGAALQRGCILGEVVLERPATSPNIHRGVVAIDIQLHLAAYLAACVFLETIRFAGSAERPQHSRPECARRCLHGAGPAGPRNVFAQRILEIEGAGGVRVALKLVWYHQNRKLGKILFPPTLFPK